MLIANQQKEHRENVTKDAKTKFLLQLAMSNAIFQKIMNVSTAKEAWKILQDEFQGSDKVRQIKLQTLRRDFENLKMKNSETVEEYSYRISHVVNQMKIYGDNISYQTVVEKILLLMPTKFDLIISTIEQSGDISKLSVVELLGALEAQEKRGKLREEGSSKGAFPSKHQHKPSSSKGGKKTII